MDLIPGLPEEVGLECLVRVPYTHFSSASSVCRRWNAEIRQPEFRRLRKVSGLTQPLVVMVQSRVNPSKPRSDSMKRFDKSRSMIYRLTVFEPETGEWRELPPVPGCENGLPMFCRIVGVGLNLVVMGGWDPVTCVVSNSVFVFDFVWATWRRGSDMPGGPRSFLACASDSNRTVYIAGAHDKEKNALKSALMYDTAKEKWGRLPDMAMERDECEGVFHDGKFHVIGGYNTEMQGQFSRSAEEFDVATMRWDQVQDDFLEAATCPTTCTDGRDGRLYMCRGNDVAIRLNSSWQAVAELPAEVRSSISYVTAWRGKMLVIGSLKFGVALRAHVLDLKRYVWTQIEVPAEYCGYVQSGCWLDI
ncbi:hypothetical protein RHSIM_Rhsim08G0218900 [Rhododendron simsii]|uniref:F-box domain-containing protein n=1 Tax=Rhododendron simsii TaxID=118357 RepID=A0A834GNL2_RHOSS|nr:hypothetical protein RHSIM_Rhsim08G0218900 [Rhododendron simsii]